MHLLVVVQEDLPNSKAIDKFIEKISSKQYNVKRLHPSWNRIRPREIRLFDFQIPREAEEEVLNDLAIYETHGIEKLTKLLDNPIIARFAKKFGVERINRKNIKKPKEDRREIGVRIAVLGKYNDFVDDKGFEYL